MKPPKSPRDILLRVGPERLWPFGLAAFCGLSMAQEVRHADIERELRQARFEQVFTLSDRALADRPRDPQVRFWRALAQDKLGRTEQALTEYQALVQDHPELPEPHNNLGVLLLRRGDLDAAHAAFQQALRMDAGYAEAMENLGDVLVLQARRLYQQSAQSGPPRPALRDKINALPLLPSPQKP
ncbi:MAG: tetratricopeptide repeat protein [Alphaproteobacteria bacterium]|nr:tetratricopeptide repeat protein [Alphaproteobacteria bacterium]